MKWENTLDNISLSKKWPCGDKKIKIWPLHARVIIAAVYLLGPEDALSMDKSITAIYHIYNISIYSWRGDRRRYIYTSSKHHKTPHTHIIYNVVRFCDPFSRSVLAAAADPTHAHNLTRTYILYICIYCQPIVVVCAHTVCPNNNQTTYNTYTCVYYIYIAGIVYA